MASNRRGSESIGCLRSFSDLHIADARRERAVNRMRVGRAANGHAWSCDAGMTARDAGMTARDTGMTARDTGMTARDTGMTARDTAACGRVAGTPATDTTATDTTATGEGVDCRGNASKRDSPDQDDRSEQLNIPHEDLLL
jgi:hypothetical protein